jgi:hypothetical protein
MARPVRRRQGYGGQAAAVFFEILGGGAGGEWPAGRLNGSFLLRQAADCVFSLGGGQPVITGLKSTEGNCGELR